MKEITDTKDLLQMISHMTLFYEVQESVMLRLQNLLADISEKPVHRAKFPEIPSENAMKMAVDMSYAIKTSQNLKGFFESLSNHLIEVTKR